MREKLLSVAEHSCLHTLSCIFYGNEKKEKKKTKKKAKKVQKEKSFHGGRSSRPVLAACACHVDVYRVRELRNVGDADWTTPVAKPAASLSPSGVVARSLLSAVCRIARRAIATRYAQAWDTLYLLYIFPRGESSRGWEKFVPLPRDGLDRGWR